MSDCGCQQTLGSPTTCFGFLISHTAAAPNVRIPGLVKLHFPFFIFIFHLHSLITPKSDHRFNVRFPQ